MATSLRTAACLILVALVTAHPMEGRAELRPKQVAILSNTTNQDSLAVAQHYAERRGIPSSHIIRLSLPDREYLSRDEYNRLVLEPVRRALEKAGLASTIRVLVTTYGIPLRVAAPTLSSDEQRWLSEAERHVRTTRNRIEELALQLERMIPGQPAPESPRDQSGQVSLEMARTVALLSRVEQTLRAGVEHRPSSAIPQLIRQYGGWSRSLQSDATTERPAEVAPWRSLLERTGPLWSAIGLSPLTSHRPLIYRWTERLFGLRGVLELASAEVDFLTTAHADASLDSELSLLWWDRTLTPAAWRIGNPLFYAVSPKQEQPPVLMVSRLDGPTAEIAKGLVDNALTAEQAGPRGTFYFDARGLQSKGVVDTYGVYDQSLRDAAAFARERSSFPVVLDDAEPTMAAIPNVVLYIGWYKLRAYDDVFSFTPGAIGYHMASAEALSVHDPAERGWCKNALERGITATMGSVGEPYLDAFPEPARFTRFFLAGTYSLAEVYYLTSRYLSWRMVLFGDPLYNPMRNREIPAASVSEPMPPAPAEQRLGDPASRLTQHRQSQADRFRRLVSILQDAETGLGTSLR